MTSQSWELLLSNSLWNANLGPWKPIKSPLVSLWVDHLSFRLSLGLLSQAHENSCPSFESRSSLKYSKQVKAASWNLDDSDETETSLPGSNLKSSSVQCLAQKRLNDVGQSQKQVWNQQQTFYTRTHPPTPFRSRALGWVAGLSHELRFHLLAEIIMLRNHDCGRCSLTWSWRQERFFKIPQKIFCLIDFE